MHIPCHIAVHRCSLHHTYPHWAIKLFLVHVFLQLHYDPLHMTSKTCFDKMANVLLTITYPKLRTLVLHVF